ncbi:MAG TPA: gliding motility-associated C-terminal domain-containing protein [Bacteroidia bacterium]|jgi:gliding motility-associated-like protein|nr:gliding motility-associated C-terminal domain-containing protein [Bacteroidia bacterium]
MSIRPTRFLIAFCLMVFLLQVMPAKAQDKEGKVNEAEMLWQSCDHKAFHRGLEASLGVSDQQYDAFQKYLIFIKKTWKDQELFFDLVHQEKINTSEDACKYFSTLLIRYRSYYPDFLVYTDSLVRVSYPDPVLLSCGQDLSNPGFEDNNFSSWDQQEGFAIDGSGLGGVTLVPGAGQSFITSPGSDPLVGSDLQRVYPGQGGGNHSAMIGNGPLADGRAGAISISFTVSQASVNFSYDYAVVLEAPSIHTAPQQPYFFLTLSDQSGNILPNGAYSVTAGPGIPGFTLVPGTDAYYKNWTSVYVDLSAYVGQCLTLTFICRDCTQGSHYGYAYMDASNLGGHVTTPNVMTPNGDGINDEFKINCSGIASLHCLIFNRWGVLVGELNDINDTWDGHDKTGIACIPGVYYYTVKAKDFGGHEVSEKGFVQLLR